jgi:hypothetical protein
MNDGRFDRLAKRFGQEIDRRTLLRGLILGTLAGLLGRDATAAPKDKPPKVKKPKDKPPKDKKPKDGCPAGLTDCPPDGCVDLRSDAAHCGACSAGCPVPDSICVAGNCGCRAGLTLCAAEGSVCRDLRTDPEHCGTCDTACNGCEDCQGGSCVVVFDGEPCLDENGDPACCQRGCEGVECGPCAGCEQGECVPSGLTECGSACVDTAGDPAHCGGCGTACAAGEACAGGDCVCADAACTDGSCRPPDGCCPDETPCPEGSCVAEGECCPEVDDGGDCSAASGDAGTCCNGHCVNTRTNSAYCGGCNTTCAAGLICEGGSCVCDGLACSDGFCRPPGGCCPDERPCADGTCMPETACCPEERHCPGIGCWPQDEPCPEGPCRLPCGTGCCPPEEAWHCLGNGVCCRLTTAGGEECRCVGEPSTCAGG